MTQTNKGGSISSNAVTKLVNASIFKSMNDQASNKFNSLSIGGSVASNAVTKLVNQNSFKSMNDQASNNITGGLCMKCTKCGGTMKVLIAKQSKKGGDIPVGSSLITNNSTSITSSGGKKKKKNKKSIKNIKKGGTFGESLYELTNNFQNTKPINFVNNESISQEVKSELPLFPTSSKALESTLESTSPLSPTNISQLVKIPQPPSLNIVKPSTLISNVSSSASTCKSSPILPSYDLIQSKSSTFIGGKKCKKGGKKMENYEAKTLSQLMSQDSSNSNFFLNNKKGGKKILKGGDLKDVPVGLQYSINSRLPVNTYGDSSSSLANKTITDNIIANQHVSSLSSIGKSTVYGNPIDSSVKFVYSSSSPITTTDVIATQLPTATPTNNIQQTCQPSTPQTGGNNKLQKKIKLLFKRAKLIQSKKH